MKQEVIDRFNAMTAAAAEDYAKARDGGFGWMWFAQRARQKAMESGFLPQQGYLLFEPRYINSASSVLNGLLSACRSVEGPNMLATRLYPWQRADIEEWRELALAFSVMMFDAGCIAAHTWGHEEGFDPLAENAPASIFGDVGFVGLRDKSIGFLRTLGGEDAVALAVEIGDCSCAHLYADRNFVDRAFAESEPLREAYFRGVCNAAYIAGATFAKCIGEIMV